MNFSHLQAAKCAGCLQLCLHCSTRSLGTPSHFCLNCTVRCQRTFPFPFAPPPSGSGRGSPLSPGRDRSGGRLTPTRSASPYLGRERGPRGQAHRGRRPEATASGPPGARPRSDGREGGEAPDPPAAPPPAPRPPPPAEPRAASSPPRGGAEGLGRFCGARPALLLPFSLLVLAPHLEGWERCRRWTGLLDVSDHGPEPRGRAGRAPGISLLASRPGETPQRGPKDGVTVLRERQRPPRHPAGQPPADPQPGRGRALPALPGPALPAPDVKTPSFPHSFSPTCLRGSNLTLLITC